MSARQLMLGIVCAALCGRAGLAADPNVAELQKVVSESAERFAKAFAERDAKALASLFTSEAEYIDSEGTVFHGRSAIEAEYAASFPVDRPGTLEIELVSIRPIADGVMVEEGISTFTPQAGGPESQLRYTATHVKQPDGSWLLASVRELETAAMSPHDRLQALVWLVGDWREEVDGSLITSKWAWSKDGNFLLSDFSVRQSRERDWQGTHRVGWDAERKQFRSWIFDASGGAGEGWWRANEDGSWSVNLTAVDAEGVRLSSLLSYQRDGADAIVVTQEQRVRGGDSLPGSMHRVVRQPPQPATATTRR